MTTQPRGKRLSGMASVWGSLFRLLTAALVASAAAGPIHAIPFFIAKTSQLASSPHGKPQSRPHIKKHDGSSELSRNEATKWQRSISKASAFAGGAIIIFSGLFLLLLSVLVFSLVVGIAFWFLPTLILGTILIFSSRFSDFFRRRSVWLMVGSAAGLLLMRFYPTLLWHFLFSSGFYSMMLEYALAGGAAAMVFQIIYYGTARVSDRK